MVDKKHELFPILKRISDLQLDLSEASLACDKKTLDVSTALLLLSKTQNWIDGSYNYFEGYLKRNNLFMKHEVKLREYNHYRKNVQSSASKAKTDINESNFVRAKKRIISVKDNINRIMLILSKFKD